MAEKVAYMNQGDETFAKLVDILAGDKATRVVIGFKISGEWTFLRAARNEDDVTATLEDVGAAAHLATCVNDWFDAACDHTDKLGDEE